VCLFVLCSFVRSHTFYLSLFLFILNPPFVSFSFSLLEFIRSVCVLRWLCRGAIVAYYVECTNMVKKYCGSNCVNRGYQGRRGWVFKLLIENFTSVMFVA